MIRITALIMMALIASCATISRNDSNIKPDDILKLDDQTKSYLYLGDYSFMPMRPGYGVGILAMAIDSATFDSSRALCVKGTITETLYNREILSASVIVGTIDTLDGQILNDNAPPTPLNHYRINPQYEVTSDSSGRFKICGVVDAKSYLIIANKGDRICLYHVGRFVKDSARSAH